jgi:hypothetical protein
LLKDIQRANDARMEKIERQISDLFAHLETKFGAVAQHMETVVANTGESHKQALLEIAYAIAQIASGHRFRPTGAEGGSAAPAQLEPVAAVSAGAGHVAATAHAAHEVTDMPYVADTAHEITDTPHAVDAVHGITDTAHAADAAHEIAGTAHEIDTAHEASSAMHPDTVGNASAQATHPASSGGDGAGGPHVSAAEDATAGKPVEGAPSNDGS